MKVEFRERTLGQVLEGDDKLTGLGVRFDRADQFDVRGEAVCGENQAVAIAGLGVAEIDGAWNRAWQRRAGEADGADL